MESRLWEQRIKDWQMHSKNQLRITRILLSVCLVTIASLFVVVAAHSQEPKSDLDLAASQSWNDHVIPIIENTCLDCHSGDDADGSLNLEQFKSIQQVATQRRLWSKIANRVRDHQMPPADSIEMADSDRVALLNWIDDTLPKVSCAHPNHAGAVTIRRLTRYEYANTIRELLKVDHPFTDSFPTDPVGYGFDSIGDVLSISPLLLEKYLTAAESIAEKVIFDLAKHRMDLTISASDFGKVSGARVRGAFMGMSTNGTISVDVNVAIAGRYQIEVPAYGSQAGDELPKMALSINGKMIQQVSVRPDNDEEAKDFRFSARLAKGRNKVEVTFLNDYYNPEHPNPRKRDRNLAVGPIRIDGPTDALRPSKTQASFLFVTPESGTAPRDCAQKIINLHAARAFRRRVYKNERERLLSLFDLGIENGESFEGAMQLVLQAILVSPHFLYKVEAPVPGDGSIRQLGDYELASSLSYFLWSSMPDDQLFRMATKEGLGDRKVLAAEVTRMLKDEKSIALIDNFASQWLQLRLLEQTDPDPERFPGFSDHLRKSMLQETRLLMADVIQQDQPLTTLLSANYTYVNKSLARHYGWSTQGLRERQFSKVSLDGKPRRGLLSQASFLILTSNPTRTSPVKRGKWVLENLLADPPPPASPDVPKLDAQSELTGTLRQRMEQHRADPNCAACHYKMDSLGFALENFDAFGRYRESAEGQLIDSTGTLPGGHEISSVIELQDFIVRNQRKQFIRCVVEKLFIYALGRGPIATDDCLIDEISTDAFEQDHRFSDIVKAIVTSEAFLGRSRLANHPHSNQTEGNHEHQN